jgi:peptidyl-tRNA hydrolase, PTH1 family
LKLIVGLGNPGDAYRETRHNVGFKVVDVLADRHHVESWREKFGGLEARSTIGEQAALFVKPLSFMNLSGQAVQAFSAFYKIAIPELLVIVDDAELPLGRLRARSSGGAGGHNGLKSVIESLGTKEFARLRIGVGRGPGELGNHVLGRFRPEEHDVISAAVLRAADATEVFIAKGIAPAMNAFNAAEKAEKADSAE